MFRASRAIVRTFVALALTLAMPAQWEAFCGGWQSPHDAMVCCQQTSHSDSPSAAVGCCAAQEQARHAQSPVPAVVAIQLVQTPLPVRALVPEPLRAESTHCARVVESRLLGSVFLI